MKSVHEIHAATQQEQGIFKTPQLEILYDE